MFRSIIKNQYLGKAGINILECPSNYTYPKETLIGKVFHSLYMPGINTRYLPDLYINGYYPRESDPIFLLNIPYPKHSLYITGVPKICKDLDEYRLKGREWESYYEDDHHGYLFQILPYNQLLITEKEYKEELKIHLL